MDSFFSLCGERGSKYHYRRAIIGPLAKRHAIYGVSPLMALRWRADYGPFQWIPTCIARKPYIFVIFWEGGGVLTPAPLWIRACILTNCFSFLKNHYNFQIYLQCPLMPSLGVDTICLFYDISFFCQNQ